MATPETLPRIIVSSADRRRLDSLADASGGARDGDLADRLASELARAEIVEPDDVPRGVVRMNSRVSVRDLDSGEVRNFDLVYPQEADAARGRVSILAPMGCAVLGLAEGQTIAWPLPEGRTRRIQVVSVSDPGAA